VSDPTLGVRARLVELTPKKAEKLLEHNVHNRGVNWTRVQQYASDMRKGDWQINGEAIKVAADGQILDGQHRLLAILEADTPVQTLLITGLAPETQETMDQGKARGFGDALKLRGEKQYTMLAAAVRIVCLYERDGVPFHDGGRKPAPSIAQLSRTLERNGELRDSVEFASAHRRPWLPTTVVAALHHLFAIADAESAADFFSKLATGDELSASSPIYVLRERLIAEHADKDRHLNPKVQLAFIIRTWNAYMEGETIRRLVFNAGGANPDRFPAIFGLADPTTGAPAAESEGGGFDGQRDAQGRRRALVCGDCGEQLREPSPTGLCGFCDPTARTTAAAA
jgi:hypothetical protein